jgi:SHS2 domain-containing protein
MSFRFLEHTADLRVECRAGSFEELLEAAAQALYSAALTVTYSRTDFEHTLELPAGGHEERLVRWLQELIFLMEVEHFVAAAFQFQETGAGALGVTLRGYGYRPEDRAAEIKAATYHGISVEKTQQGFVAQFLLDV